MIITRINQCTWHILTLVVILNFITISLIRKVILDIATDSHLALSQDMAVLIANIMKTLSVELHMTLILMQITVMPIAEVIIEKNLQLTIQYALIAIILMTRISGNVKILAMQVAFNKKWSNGMRKKWEIRILIERKVRKVVIQKIDIRIGISTIITISSIQT